MDKWYIIFGIGGWACFIVSAIVAGLKFYILNGGWNEDYQRALQTLSIAERDAHEWKNKYTELKHTVDLEKLAEKVAKDIVEGKSNAR